MPVEMKRLLGSLDVDAGEDNIVGLVDLGIGIEAVGDRVLVLMDSFKSGYECPTCAGIGKIHKESRCVCDPPENSQQYQDNLEAGIKPGTRNRFGAICEECLGEYLPKRYSGDVTCSDCNGRGATLHIPERAKSLPTTGIILSIGPEVTKLRVNQRVICTPHAGVMLPMKGNIRIKVFREHEPLAYMYKMNKDGRANKEDPGQLGTPKFVEHDTPLGEDFEA